MKTIVIVGAGMMGSAMSYPARDNGNCVRLVGTSLDREIIEEAKKTGWHKTLKRQLPDGIEYFQIEELDKALEGADLLILLVLLLVVVNIHGQMVRKKRREARRRRAAEQRGAGERRPRPTSADDDYKNFMNRY